VRVDVACVGSPFLDLIFRGLPAIPRPGEEELARDLVIVPGAIANVAYALNRLGLEAVVCAPIGRDAAGRLLAELMAEAGVGWVGGSAERTPVSVALPVDGDRAFVTSAPEQTVDVDALRSLDPRAVVVDLPNVARLPDLPGAAVYGVVGDPEVRALEGNVPPSLGHLRALICNDREVRGLGRMDDEAGAAAALAARGTTVVVTCGRNGVFATEPDGRVTTFAAPLVEVHDTTGAGDLFTAAYVWSDLGRRPLQERLEVAVTYASLSLAAASRSLPTAPTRQKGMTRQELEAALPARASGGAAVRG
jgi:sugar/nucleoside kinase (ribokinase family)